MEQNYNQNPYVVNRPQKKPGQGFATASLTCGIIGLFFCQLILGIVAIATGISALDKGYKGAKPYIGYILGIVGLIVYLILFIATINSPEFLKIISQLK